jgi:hypothetical protein
VQQMHADECARHAERAVLEEAPCGFSTGCHRARAYWNFLK